jgi:type I restriction enzyme S subunit
VLEAGGTAEDAELAAMEIIAAKSTEKLAELKQSKPDAYDQLAQTAALFPSVMQDSELGKIPEGWEILALAQRGKIY